MIQRARIDGLSARAARAGDAVASSRDVAVGAIAATRTAIRPVVVYRGASPFAGWSLTTRQTDGVIVLL